MIELLLLKNMKRKFYDPKKYAQYGGHTFLPAVEFSKSLFPKDHLKNTYLISCQHILPSTHMMLRSMIDIGLDINNIAMIGKCYSSDQETMDIMLREGIYVCPSSVEFDSDKSFDQQFNESIKSFLSTQIERMQPNKDARIIILDDGGALITAAQCLADTYTNICGVEQTSSGNHRLSSMSLKFPVIDVAQSKAKSDFESPLIAKSIMDNLEKKLNISLMTPKEVLVIGNGLIGNSIYKILTNECSQHNTTTYDAVKERSEIDHLDFSIFDIIIGATGDKVMSHHYFDSLKKGCVLVSVSSSDREFDGAHFRRLSGKKWNTHDDAFYNGICLINCGFPINFSGGKRASIPLMQIQFVCSLLFLGVCEAVNYKKDDGQMIKLNNNFIANTFNRSTLVA